MSESHQSAGLSVLVADDDPVSLRFLEGALRELGCVVTAVADGDAAIRTAREKRFDLLLLDRRMPGTGGAELLLALRRSGVAIAAVATSADIDDAVRDELLAAGYTDALTKPIRLDALARAVSTYSQSATLSSSAAETQISAATSLLDDAMGLNAVGGDAATLKALRALLASDLDALVAGGTPPGASALADALHRLRAACRYCGAMRLETAAIHLEKKARAEDNVDTTDIAAFLDCCVQTKRAIAQTMSP